MSNAQMITCATNNSLINWYEMFIIYSDSPSARVKEMMYWDKYDKSNWIVMDDHIVI